MTGIRLQSSGVGSAALGLIPCIVELQTSAFPFFYLYHYQVPNSAHRIPIY